MLIINKFDPDGDNTISFDEGQLLSNALGLTKEELTLMFNEIDSNGDG